MKSGAQPWSYIGFEEDGVLGQSWCLGLFWVERMVSSTLRAPVDMEGREIRFEYGRSPVRNSASEFMMMILLAVDFVIDVLCFPSLICDKIQLVNPRYF